MKARVVQLTLQVTYTDPEHPDKVPDEEVCLSMLKDSVFEVIGSGCLTEKEYSVEDYNHKVKTIMVGDYES